VPYGALELPQAPQVGAKHHQAQVSLVAQESRHDDLVAVRPSSGQRLSQGWRIKVTARRDVAEEMEHRLSDRRDKGGVSGHERQCREQGERPGPRSPSACTQDAKKRPAGRLSRIRTLSTQKRVD
jgi:hypothetical protein